MSLVLLGWWAWRFFHPPLTPPAPPQPSPSLLSQPVPTEKPWRLNPSPSLQLLLEEVSHTWGLGQAGLVLIDLKTGETATSNEKQTFDPASIIKVPLMIATFRQIEAAQLSLDQPIAIQAGNITSSANFPEDQRPILQTGQAVTVETLVDLMITRSDNTATNTLLDLVGRPYLNQYLQQLGIKQTHFGYKLIGDANSPVEDAGYTGQHNTTTAWDMAILMTAIAKHTLFEPPTLNQKMLEILSQQLDREKIPKYLPAGIRVYHKTGENTQATHDVAIVQAPEVIYVLVILTSLSPGQESDRQIGQFAAALHEKMRRR